MSALLPILASLSSPCIAYHFSSTPHLSIFCLHTRNDTHLRIQIHIITSTYALIYTYIQSCVYTYINLFKFLLAYFLVLLFLLIFFFLFSLRFFFLPYPLLFPFHPCFQPPLFAPTYRLHFYSSPTPPPPSFLLYS